MPIESKMNMSGSTALIALIVDDKCYVANLGDSRAVISMKKGTMAMKASSDHSLKNIEEMDRGSDHGGMLVSTAADPLKKNAFQPRQTSQSPKRLQQFISPGNSKVTRAFGLASSKLKKYGGKEGMISSEPNIKVMSVK